jgi:hypothetical protein
MREQLINHLVKESIYSYFFNPKMKDIAISKDLQELTQLVKKLSKQKHYVVFIVEDNIN